MSDIRTLAARRPGGVLAGALLVSALAASQLVDLRTGAFRLELDPSVDRLLPQGDQTREFYDHVRLLFGSDETLVVALVAPDVFTAENLRRIRRIAERATHLDAVQRVVSLDNALDMKSEDGDLVIEPFLDAEIPEDREALAAIRRDVLDNPIYAGSLVAQDGRAAAIVVYLRDLPERELVASGIDLDLRRIADEERGDAEVFIAGGTVIKAETSRILVRELSRSIPLAALVVVVVALLALRTLAGVIVPVATVGTALLWTLGIVAATGTSLNLVTALVPTLLLVVGFAYAVHVVAETTDELRDRADHREAVAAALSSVALPVVLTGVTTGVGLLALATSPIGAIREFALIATLGVAATVLAALTIGPALLVILPRPRAVGPAADSAFDRLAAATARGVVRYRAFILAAGAIAGALSIWGMTHIVVSNDFLPDEGELRRNIDAVNVHLQGSNTFYVILETDYRDAFAEPENLREIAQLQDWLEAQPEIGGTTSLVDFLVLINRGFHDDDPAHEQIPDSRRLIKQLFFFAASDDLRSHVDSRYQTAAVVVRTLVNDSGAMARLVERIEMRLAELPIQLRPTVTGNGVIVARTLDEIARGQALSLSLAFTAIFAILALLFTSVRVGLLALVPNALPVLVYFGILGGSGITLNTTTGLVACLVLGIAVDDTIHFLARFNAAARQRLDETEGVAEALRAVGRPVTITSLALCLGFLTLAGSELRTHAEFGLLASITLAVAWLVDVTFTPALAARMRIVTLWDVLALDLGENPQESIPLLSGLRRTQARVAALMASIREFPEGHVLFRDGDDGDEMFVVIDGVLNASAPGREGIVDFGDFTRGAVIGEVALYHGKRTADVRAKTPVRLLRLTRRDLERLRHRYPRIGAQIQANLSQILADRVASTTQALR